MRGLAAPDRRLQLAVEVMLDIALFGGSGPVQSKDTAARLDLPRRHLEQLMQQLVRAGLLKSVRGPRGGYRLARERRRISAADILLALRESPAAESGTGSTSPLAREVLGPLWAELEALLVERLAQVSLESLCDRAAAAGCAPRAPDVDFVI
ncbi:MAG: Rrf2 family transcriptional regulator [Geminicoccaceae bacterium]|nr:Rrf2 family transcriptional regulator [Geminicoccaceae bacterium]MCX8099991.1 Rrf2 family transcriptional regulator [Geminicoccaceae bacterium]MDW8369781.1 Rrf2 family transcriptional regulator [Geminicoccaceae bacterium]